MKRNFRKRVLMFSIMFTLFNFFSGCTKKEKLTSLGPVISSVTVTSSSITSSSATVTWVTDVAATSKVFYGTNTSFGSSTQETDTGVSRTKNHSVTLTGLSASTKYYVYVESKDSNGNGASSGRSGDYSFTTSASGPTISNINVSATSNSATITWTTSEAATSQVFYGTTPAFASSSTETTTFNTNHAVTLTGLTTNTVYYYYVRSKNSQGNSSIAGNDGSRTFITSTTSSGTTIYLYLDDIKIEGTGGTPITIYDDDFSSTIFTGGNNNNIAWMGNRSDGGSDNIKAMDTTATDDKHSGSTSWKITMEDTTTWWAGMFILASGAWRANWTGTETAADLTGPTGTVKLTCWAKISGTTSTKIKIGIGDNNNNKTPYDSITGGKKESPKLTIDTTWKQLELDLTGQNLSSINGPFLWAIDGADVN